MKSQDTPAALDALRRTAGTTTPVVCLQNGVDNERAALRVFDHVYGICVMCPAAHLEPGLVQVYSSPISGLLDIGRFPRGIDATTAAVSADLSSATFESVERTDIMRWKYSKLLMNLGNAVDALCRSGGRARLSAMVVEEGEACLRAAGISFTPKDEERARRGTKIDMHESETLKRRGGSSWQSLARATGRIESDYLNGEIVLLGRLHGVPTPANVLLQDLARQASRDGIPPGSFDADELLARLDRT
jgi:2-dehydropantoate 2-reductase